jgi:hypothetical protein
MAVAGGVPLPSECALTSNGTHFFLPLEALSLTVRTAESAAGSRKAARFAYHVLRPIASGEERAQRKHREILTMNYKEATKSERFIELEVNRGRLRAVKLSNRLLRFRPIDVERWMESSLTSPDE